MALRQKFLEWFAFGLLVVMGAGVLAGFATLAADLIKWVTGL